MSRRFFSLFHGSAKQLAALAVCVLFFPNVGMAGALERAERLEIWDALTSPSAPTRTIDLTLPVEGVLRRDLRDSFDSPRSHGRRHAAIDIMAPRNTPVVAAVDGEIRKLAWSSGGGLTIYEFDRSQTRVYYYAHLQRYRDGLREGAVVHRGEVIGYVGTTGNATPDAPHLHFAIAKLPPSKAWWKGVAVDPYPLLAASAAFGDDAMAPQVPQATHEAAAESER